MMLSLTLRRRNESVHHVCVKTEAESVFINALTATDLGSFRTGLQTQICLNEPTDDLFAPNLLPNAQVYFTTDL